MTEDLHESRRHTKRRRLQLRLSTLFWIVLAVALATGWWVDRSRLAERLQADVLQIKVFSLAFAQADQAASVLHGTFPLNPADPRGVTIASDVRTNSLIVRGPPEKLAEIEAIVLRLDQPVGK